MLEEREPVVREIAIMSVAELERDREALRARIAKLERVRRRLNQENGRLRLERAQALVAFDRSEETIASLQREIADLARVAIAPVTAPQSPSIPALALTLARRLASAVRRRIFVRRNPRGRGQ